jgi:uncharacterized repeat protein (TIGR02543 family)
MTRARRSLERSPATAALAVLVIATAGCGKGEPGASGTGARALGVTIGDVLYLVGVPSGRCMSVVDGSAADQAALELRDCAGVPSQQLRLETADGYYVLRVVGSDRCLAVSGASINAGAGVVQATCSGAASQQWSGTDLGNGAYRITSRSSGMAVGAYGAGTANGTKIVQWPENGGANQQWRVVAASDVKSYAVTLATSGSGTTSPAAGTYTVLAGTTGQVTATPAAGYTFTGWSGAATGTANPVTITVDRDMTLTANFTSGAAASYTLAVDASGNGSTSPAPGAHTYAPGAAVQVTATPTGGATFAGWSGAATGTGNPVTVTMDGDKTLTATFSGGSTGLPARCPGQCNAATPVYPTVSSVGGVGNVTMYTTAPSDGGACNYGTTKVMYFAAMSVNVQLGDGRGLWQGGRICGQCAEATALTSQGPKTVVVRIMDKCPDAYCGIDLGGAAPGAVMIDGTGRYDGKWRLVSCAGHPEVSDGAPSLYVLQGSNAWWSRVQVRNPSTAVDTIEWQDASNAAARGTFPYATDPENSFEVPVDAVLQSSIASFLLTVHYVDGSEATVRVSRAQLASEKGSYPLDVTLRGPSN